MKRSAAVIPILVCLFFSGFILSCHGGNGADYQKCIRDCNKALAKNPRDWRAYKERARAYYALRFESRGNKEQAVRDVSRAIDINPTDHDAYFTRALFLQPKVIVAEDFYSGPIIIDTESQWFQDYIRAAELGNKHAQEGLRKRGILRPQDRLEKTVDGMILIEW